MKKLESEIEKQFVRQFKDGEAVKIYKTHWPDRLIVLKNGQHLFIEFKRPGEPVRPGQNEIHKWLRSCGHPCFVARSVTEAFNWVDIVKKVLT